MKIHNIEFDIEKLSKNEKTIANYMSKNAARIPTMNLQELSQEIRVSTATISRFCVSIGFSGFKQFKARIKSNPDITPARKFEDIFNQIEDKDVISEIINKTVNYLKITEQRLSRDEFEKAIHALDSADRIYIYGPGPSESLTSLLAFRLSRFDFDIRKMAKSGHELFESLIHLTKDDVVIIFGFFNNLPETHVILDYAGQIGYKTILMTDLMVSDMIDRSDIVLYTERGELWEFHSMVTPVAIIDSLVVGIAMRHEKEYLERLNKLHSLRKKYASHLPK